MKKIYFYITLLLASSFAHANITDDLDDFVGYTIIASKTIEGYQDKNGKKDDSFEGCDYDRLIIFSDDKILICAGYSYHYAYRPKAIILSNGSSFKMIVGDDVYDMHR